MAMTRVPSLSMDLNYSNPRFFMLENILFFANLGVDILPHWCTSIYLKQLGTTCQNPTVHAAHFITLTKQCVQVAAHIWLF